MEALQYVWSRRTRICYMLDFPRIFKCAPPPFCPKDPHLGKAALVGGAAADTACVVAADGGKITGSKAIVV
ncbi:uncharacterized protein PG998_010809 [Apiospora kogelbergensis]|uniref:Uncharacterized protein n=1 Tax=Apiospora kogelbergensis TaxID=1337665 RepID=A0AAW0RDP5_9PEZI